MTPLRIHNPYLSHGFRWFSGNLHAHSTLTDGKLPPQEVLSNYAAAGHDFLALTDHDIQSDYTGLDDCGLLLLAGNEITANAQHLLHIGGTRQHEPVAQRQQVLDAISSDAGFAVLAHPSWQEEYAYYSNELLLELNGFLGLEIFNGVIRRLKGSPLAVNQWDYLLSRGRRVYGFATDDSHDFQDIALGWNVVQATYPDRPALMEAFAAGRFYASTGVRIESVRSSGNRIAVTTGNATAIALVTDHSVRLATSEGQNALFELPADFSGSYVRIECWGPGEQQAWSQPLWISRPD